MVRKWIEKRKVNGRNYILRRVGTRNEIIKAQVRWESRNARTKVIVAKTSMKRPNFPESGKYALYVRKVNV